MIPAFRKTAAALLQTIAFLGLTAICNAQIEGPKTFNESEISDLIQTRIKQVDDLSDLDDETKGKIKDLYKQASIELETAKRWNAAIAQNEKLVSEAPTELAKTKKALDTLPAHPESIPSQANLSQIEQAISEREADLEKLRKALADNEAALKGGATRRAKLAEQISTAKERLGGINERIQLPAAADEKPAVAAARQLLLDVQRQTAEQEIVSCEKELKAIEARADLLPLRRDLDARQVALAEQTIKQWQDEANLRRKKEAEQQAERASLVASQASPCVQELLEQNSVLAKERKDLAERITDYSDQLVQVNQRLGALNKEFNSVKEKVKTVGLTNKIGAMLRIKRETLAGYRAYGRNISTRQEEIGTGQLKQLQYRDDSFALYDLDLSTKAVLDELDPATATVDRNELDRAIRQALTTKREYLDALVADHDIYYDKLVKLKKAEQDLIDATEYFSQYINERVLWIASAGFSEMGDVNHIGDAAWWLVGPETWLGVGRAVVEDARNNPFLWFIALGFFLILLFRRGRLRTKIEEIGQQTARGSCYRFWPTMEAAGLGVLLAVGWPGLTWFFGWRLTEASETYRPIGMGFTETSQVFLALELLRNVCRRGGLGEAHFGWSNAALKLVRQNIRWFSVFVLPLMFISVALAWRDYDKWDASLGRIAFIAALLCFSFILHRVYRPTSVISQSIIAPRRGGWLDRFRYVWYPLIAFSPVVLALLAVIGYHYTSRQLVIRLILSIYVLVGGMVCRALLLRWTLVNQRKLAIEQAKQRRAASQSEGASGDDGIADLPSTTTHERDLASINIQTRRLIEYSLGVACALVIWCAWVDILPALNILNRIEIYPSFTVVENAVSADGKILSEVSNHPNAVTLGNVVFAALALATTAIAAKNIPGLLEMAVLQHMPFDAGARYAIATVFRYLITMIGMVACFGSLGISWDKVQWLVAAMSLGLGFGLQEIFANFISGLIILFERPIRVGDVVTIGDISGKVSRIHMRATTITDWDRKELIIPNKEFITGRVLNWTLSDPVNRVVVNVGIAYGSDTQGATEILTRLAQDHPMILDDPPPRVTLESFGDSALNFVLRCFLPNLDNRVAVIHELHMGIDQAFREAGIEIAFPQQDVHVRSIDLPASAIQSGKEAAWRAA